ncbi:uncharacterized protein CELE_F28B3.6 [Caenorhabditis elegans]|uniref:Uncharacterized protein n=1 Tax=Caenorhabditis elegans TaxID=6239 RepID=Q86NJ0_CAEEL|nr:Uncharacterized protein CELE_F28B3.6 [Caenorhabditis elegans]CCD69825.1 Uncharacterized protein CELE_F28B3.6 [Caenorhabditis elegans]|eukprot:NP_001021423.1 Uncharacterized protein CELE_F28B3.6 [Caenorhabditis elegans]
MGVSSGGNEDARSHIEKMRDFMRKKMRRPIDDYYDWVPRPGTQFCIHMTIRSIQTAAVVGSVLGPVSALLMHRSEKKELVDAFVIGGLHGAMVGAALGPVISLATCKNMNRVRKFQNLVKNKFDQTQLWQDHIAIASAAVGYMSSGQLGLVVGLDLSLLFAVITRNL